MHVLVTGATGGLGHHAVQYLLAQGCQVRATGRNRLIGEQLAAMGAEFIPLDLATTSSQDLQALLLGIQTVWHCAARSSPWGAESAFVAANVTATERLLGAAGTSRVTRFVHVSTPAIYFDFCHHLNIGESFRSARYVNAYARTKAMAEDCVRAATENHPHMRSIILRPRAIFGEHDQVLIPRLQRMLHQYDGHLLLPRAGKTLLDLTYAGNVAHAMWLATVHPTLPSGMAFNITNHQSVVLRDVLTRLFVEELKQSMRIVNLNYRLLDMVARCLELVSALSGREPVMTRYSVGAVYYDMTLDNRLAQQVLGYRPMVSMNEGLQRTAQWLKGLTHG